MSHVCTRKYFLLILLVLVEIFAPIIDGNNTIIVPTPERNRPIAPISATNRPIVSISEKNRKIISVSGNNRSIVSTSDFARNHGRIVGGSQTTIESHPFLVQVEYHIRDKPMIQFLNCGGTILRHDVIITAGQCMVDSIEISGCKVPVDAYVRAGTVFRGVGGLVIRVKEYFVHPQFKEAVNERLRIPIFDVALLKLERPLKYAFGPGVRSPISPIPLASYKDNITAGAKCGIAGWGIMESKVPEYISNKLQHTNMTILPTRQCHRIFKKFEIERPEVKLRQNMYVDRPVNPVQLSSQILETLFNQMICASYNLDQRSPCFGDAGGPLIAKKKLYGIVSWGVDCYDPRYAYVFVKLTDPLISNWIKRTMDKLRPPKLTDVVPEASDTSDAFYGETGISNGETGTFNGESGTSDYETGQ